MKKEKIKIDLVSDVACPWCLIGKKQLEAAVSELYNELEFEISSQPYQLDPSIPQNGMDWNTYFEGKFGSLDRVDSIFHRVESAGKQVGVKFNFRGIPLIPNTLNLHMLIQACKNETYQLALTEKLFSLYMLEPQDLTDIKTLVSLMKEFGWNETKTQSVLNDNDLRYEVKSAIKKYQQMGVSGVPYFIINDKYGITGAQPKEVLIDAFRSISKEMSTLQGDTCDIENGNC